MKTTIFIFATKIALPYLRSLAQAIWEGFWATILEGVQEAEQLWERAGRGREKKRFVIEKTMAYLDSHVKINPIMRWIIKLFLRRVIDAIIRELNDGIGRHWIGQISNLRAHLASHIPFID